MGSCVLKFSQISIDRHSGFSFFPLHFFFIVSQNCYTFPLPTILHAFPYPNLFFFSALFLFVLSLQLFTQVNSNFQKTLNFVYSHRSSAVVIKIIPMSSIKISLLLSRLFFLWDGERKVCTRWVPLMIVRGKSATFFSWKWWKNKNKSRVKPKSEEVGKYFLPPKFIVSNEKSQLTIEERGWESQSPNMNFHFTI